MLKFNNNHILTGYIKQLLASFNLPKCKVYVEGEPIIKTRIFKNKDKVTMYVPYIKDNELQEYIINDSNKGNWYPKG